MCIRDRDITSDILSPVQLMRRCLKTPLLVLEWSFGANRDFAVIEAVFIHGGQLVRQLLIEEEW